MLIEQEQEANLFSLYLLMPTELFKRDMEHGIDIEDDTGLTELCKKYQASQSMLLLRIKMYFKDEYHK